jgi:hypothetical protein
MQQVRKIVRRTTRRIVGSIAIPHLCDQLIEWESMLERDAIYLLGFLPCVRRISAQPLELEYVENLVTRRHIPDLLVETTRSRDLIEVKPQSKVAGIQERTKLVTPIAREKGYGYRVLTDQSIRIQPRLSNIKLLMRYRAVLPAPNAVSALNMAFSERPQWKMGDLLLRCEDVNLIDIYAMLVHHMLYADLNLPISANTEVMRFSNEPEVSLYETLFD